MRFGARICLACVVVLVACNKPTQPPPAGSMGAAVPPRPTAAAATAMAPLTGKLAERVEAGTYSYLRITTADGDVWAAVPQTTAAVGTDVSVANPMLMQNFESKTLQRTFEKVYFGTLGSGAPAAAPMGAAMPAGHPSVAAGTAPAAPVAMGPVAKAAGADAHTVAEIWEQKATLGDKSVTLHATVVKSTSGILGKNWLHLRDGSGTDAKQDNDLTITSVAGTAAVGDVVTVKGNVRLGKDFGAGYAYPVMIEEASVTKD